MKHIRDNDTSEIL